jgi:hypothetical protein
MIKLAPTVCPRCGGKVGKDIFEGGNGDYYGITHATHECGKLMVNQDGREVIGEEIIEIPEYGLIGWIFGSTSRRSKLLFGKRKYKPCSQGW